MPQKRTDFVQKPFASSKEWKGVLKIADALTSHMAKPEIRKQIDLANAPGRSSSEVQGVILGQATELGFKSEAKGLFNNYTNSSLRPDYYLAIDKTGIILEVERGKTTQNNMDFLDFWKCHICESAHYLFLLVPDELRQNQEKRPTRPYNHVVTHMEAFFKPANYTNVRGLVLFGY